MNIVAQASPTLRNPQPVPGGHPSPGARIIPSLPLHYPETEIAWMKDGSTQVTESHTFCVALIKDEGIWVADVPALRSCVTSGETWDEALENAKDAIRGVIKVYENVSETLPIDLNAPIERGAEIAYVTIAV